MKQPLKKHINAVVKTIKMWEWLRNNSFSEKEDYLNTHGLTAQLKEDCFLCYCWIDSKKKRDCGECPLSTKNHRCCIVMKSPFYKWDHSHIVSTRTRNSQKIVDLCKEWLKKYGLNEKGKNPRLTRKMPNRRLSKPKKIRVTRSGEKPKMVSLNQKLLNITNRKELQKALSKLTDEQYQQYKDERRKSSGMFYYNYQFNFIKLRHLLFLWMFPLKTATDHRKGGYYCEISYKEAFGRTYVLSEKIEEYK